MSPARFPCQGRWGNQRRGGGRGGLLKAGRNLWLNLKPLVVYQSKGNGIASFRVGAESEKGACSLSGFSEQPHLSPNPWLWQQCNLFLTWSTINRIYKCQDCLSNPWLIGEAKSLVRIDIFLPIAVEIQSTGGPKPPGLVSNLTIFVAFAKPWEEWDGRSLKQMFVCSQWCLGVQFAGSTNECNDAHCWFLYPWSRLRETDVAHFQLGGAYGC